jgi:hypothetical protein
MKLEISGLLKNSETTLEYMNTILSQLGLKVIDQLFVQHVLRFIVKILAMSLLNYYLATSI